MPRNTGSRERLLRTAAELFRTQGYHATGLNQVVAESGAPKGSLYFHFPAGKQQLACEAVALGASETGELLRDVLDPVREPREVVAAIVRHFAEELEGSDFRRGCPVATVALETSTGEADALSAACQQAYRSWLRLLSNYLSAKGIPELRAGELATVAIASLEGALLLAKTAGDAACLSTVGDHVAETIETELRSCACITSTVAPCDPSAAD